METAVKTAISPRTESSTSPWNVCVASGIAITIFAAVLAFGATLPYSIYGFELAAGTLFAAAWARMAVRGEFGVFRSPLMLPIGIFAAVVVVQVAFGWSAYAAATQAEALRYIGYFCLFVVAADIFRDQSVAKGFLNALVIFGSIIGIEAIVQDFSAPGLIYWRFPVPASGTVYGPFASHGLYAGFMELVAGVAIVKWLATPKNHARWLFWAFCAAVTSSSIVLSRSRAGMLALVCEIAMAALLLMRTSARRSKTMVAALIVVVLAVCVWLGTGALWNRATSFLSALNKDVNGHRLVIAADSLRMVREKPVLGWGLDVFPVAYPRYRSFATNTFINEAHNDYVQVLVETGFVGAGAVILFIVLLYRVALKRLYSRRRDSLNWLVGGALVGCTGMLVHNLFDFNFHITSNAALFYVLAAIATTRAGHTVRERATRPYALDMTVTEE